MKDIKKTKATTGAVQIEHFFAYIKSYLIETLY